MTTTQYPTLEGSSWDLPRWQWSALALAVVVLALVTFENSQFLNMIGSSSAGTSNFLHEFFHDGRHFIGVPCH